MTTSTPETYRKFLGRLAPALARANLLSDLEQRMAKALDIWGDALDAGDADKAQRAEERFYLRLVQIEWEKFRSPDAVCRRCTPKALLHGGHYSACHEHAGEALAQLARERRGR